MEMTSTANPNSGSDLRHLAKAELGEGETALGAGFAEVVLKGGEVPNIFLLPVSASVDVPVAR